MALGEQDMKSLVDALVPTTSRQGTWWLKEGARDGWWDSTGLS